MHPLKVPKPLMRSDESLYVATPPGVRRQRAPSQHQLQDLEKRKRPGCAALP